MAQADGPGRTALPLMTHAGGPRRTAPTVDGTCRRAGTDRPTVAVPDFARFPSQHLKP